MRTVQTHVSRRVFGDMMGAMRLWLDGRGNPVVRFETASDNGDIVIIVGFATDELAEAFGREFGQISAAPSLAA